MYTSEDFTPQIRNSEKTLIISRRKSVTYKFTNQIIAKIWETFPTLPFSYYIALDIQFQEPV